MARALTSPFAGVRVSARDGVADMVIYDEIGYWGITAKAFRAALDGVKEPTINLRINSPGGDVFDGVAIYNDLLQHSAQVNVMVTGVAASAASVIAMAGDV
ncbi:MAG TPA: hypothetical protein DCO82_04365, partial [Alphaproteobacteria bacterium]|nr:hypothetical protein [Alphaproteobacteria bacterium]